MPDHPEPQTFMFADDGSVPNNARLPFVIYRLALGVVLAILLATNTIAA